MKTSERFTDENHVIKIKLKKRNGPKKPFSFFNVKQNYLLQKMKRKSGTCCHEINTENRKERKQEMHKSKACDVSGGSVCRSPDGHREACVSLGC